MSILELHNISKAFGGLKAVDRVSFSFKRGRVTALIGPNGAGKTTVFNIINGFLMPDEGYIVFGGKDITGLSPWDIAGMGVGRLFQDVRVFERMTVIENMMAALRRERDEGILGAILNRRCILAREHKYAEKALGILESVGLEEKAEELAENLSYGQQKLLSMARLLATETDVLLLDEPTAGINPTIVGKVIELIRRIAARGKSIIIIEHNMNVVLKIADWAYFMDSGQVAAFGLPVEVLDDPEVRSSYIGV